LQAGSRLRGYLSGADISLAECAVFHYTPPNLVDIEWEDAEEVGLDLEQSDGIPTEITTSLRLAEALTIRYAQPLLNQAME
jgi:hypothetical protein